MAKTDLRRKAVELRKNGKSYTEIKRTVPVSKSTLSLWLRNIYLNKEQMASLKKKKERAIEKYINTMRLKREKKLKRYYDDQKTKWIPFSKREEFIAGLFLYWGEGEKSSRHTISLNNTDPRIVKFSLYWISECLGFSKEKIKVFLHLYEDMDIKQEIDFWSSELSIPKEQFLKPYIKKSRKIDLDQKGFGHGTCGVRVNNTVVKENILMALSAISDSFREKVAKI